MRILTHDEVVSLKARVRKEDDIRLGCATAWKEAVEILTGVRPHMRDYPWRDVLGMPR